MIRSAKKKAKGGRISIRPRFEPFTPTVTVPEGFFLIVDTREQKPLFEPAEWIIMQGLKTGDYSVKGFSGQGGAVVERKSLTDLYSSLGQNRERFKAELERMQELDWRGLLIEGTEIETLTPYLYSSIHPNSVYHSLCSIQIKYGLHVYYAPNEDLARKWVLSRLIKFYKMKREIK